MLDHPKVAIFWDYENCNPPSNSSGLGYDIANNIGRIARLFGSVTTFRAYLDISAQSFKSVVLRSELQSSGVSIIDCPHIGKKDVVDKMILVDMLAFAVDHPAPATIILITGDRDYAYAVSILKLRRYQVILVVPSSPHTSPSLESQASLIIDWGVAALRTRTESGNSTQAVRQPYPELNANLIAKLLKELQDPPLDDPDAAMHSYPVASQSTSKLRCTNTRDLLGSSGHHKNKGSFASTQEFTHTLASPRKSTSAGSDPAPGESHVSKTPSRSRGASVSIGPMRARSSTVAEQSLLAVEQNTPAKILPPSIVRRSSTPDITNVFSPAKRSPPVLSSLDMLELPLRDSRPPSSIIVRSPLESSQSMTDPGKLTNPSSHKHHCLASPFLVPKTTTPSRCAKQFHSMTKPETVASVCEMSKTKNAAVPGEMERLERLLFDDSDTDSDSVRSLPHTIHSVDGSRDATDTPKSNYHSYATPPSTYSSPSKNVEVHLADTPSCKHASPSAATPSRVSDGGDSPFAAVSRTSNILGRCMPDSESVLSSSASLSMPFTATESHAHDESGQGQTWTMFQPLIHVLLAAHERGTTHPARSTIAAELVQTDKQAYRRAGVSKFRDYTALAKRAGIIELGGTEAGAWIALHPNWFVVNGVTTHFLSSRVSSPTFDPPNAIQSPLLTGPKTPLIERATIFQSPDFASPEFDSPRRCDSLPASPSSRQVGTSRASIPPQFQPLIDVLVRVRAEGLHQPLRSVIGQLLGQGVYTRACVPGFKAYVHQAWEAQLVQFGGVGGHAWIRLHPELRI